MSKDKVLFEEFDATFLDPASCGSSIRWAVTLSEDRYYGQDPVKKAGPRTASLNVQVGLTDCNRTIDWSASDFDLADKKLRAAITVLRNARESLGRARRLYNTKVKANELRTDSED